MLLALAPLCHRVLLATQVLVLWCFGLSYQLLFGRTGMLSFGHAVSFGLAAFGTAHAVRCAGGAGVPVYELLPLAGAAVGWPVVSCWVTRSRGAAASPLRWSRWAWASWWRPAS
jgi:ABC-type branched-subunit amino acid transport system permease subunit